MEIHLSDTWQAMGVTHDKPCVKMHVFARHMEIHVSTCMECEIMYKWDVFVEDGGRSRKGKEKGRKGEKRIGEKKERKEKKRKRKREIRRRPVVSSLVHWRSDGQNLLDQKVKSGDSTRGYASRGRDSSYFGIFIAFGLLFWGDLEPCCAMLMA